jgi:peptidyl-prolyl cis-trans isomerase D
MRRLVLPLLLVLVPGLAGCRDALTAHADDAARAAGQTLTVERLATLMAAAKGLQPNGESARDVANFWVDFTLFSQAVAEGTAFGDSATIAAAMWRELTELKGQHWYDSLVARRSTVAPGDADRIYAGDSLRVLQHILLRVPPDAPAAERQAVRTRAEVLLAQARRGGTAEFGALAVASSGDPASARDSGFLPPSARGAYVVAFDSAGWALAPGGLSGIVETPYGYHLIRRPSADDVRGRIESWLTRGAAGRFETAYLDSLAQAQGLEIESDAPARMRAAVDDPEKHRTSKQKLATWRGGTLRVADYVQWIQALPLQFTMQVRTADDENLRNFARALGQNYIFLEQADSAGIHIPADEWTGLRLEYLGRLDTLSAVVGLGADVRDSTVPVAERRKLAAMKVDAYFDRVVSGEARLRPLPSASFAGILRSRYDHRVLPAGLQRAAELAVAKGADTTGAMPPMPGVAPGAAPSPAPAPGDLEPATGGPPVGGARPQ